MKFAAGPSGYSCFFIFYPAKKNSTFARDKFHAEAAIETSKDQFNRKCYLNFEGKYFYNFDFDADKDTIKTRRINVPTVILTGHGTASAAEDFLVYADKLTNMTRIGEPSFGSTGQPYKFDLPGGGSARVCTAKDVFPDGREFVGYGIQPNIPVKETVDDYVNNKDPTLVVALKYLKDKQKK